jgi:peptide deformylase
MTPFKVLVYPDDALKQKCSLVTEFGTEQLRLLVQRMQATIRHKNSKGFGLAANQVGIMMRVIVMNTLNSKKPGGYLGALINPEIVEYGENIEQGNEGCLSFPDERADVFRASAVRVKFQNIDGMEQTRSFTGLTAVVVQHEIDHINGITMIDRQNNG